ncbi:hypothetical protein BAUCODRAFT_175583 [Baudoinia panamericana UAMH 10762]|uniref:Uncharacterized protein n=1 Tax=Baudoinia panamericana (strain UAMH 10762) TaxID=717646 RepID=M2MUK1_BAUPA|nr:uncharacterized protein BAUCODRAFT_175583 [Baudoinia panamericana UAMH 10762]EMD00602.1 hypothetical protein BAUCODRAFT_175583 [Baudoinia panamericana UAMH 10762]
MTSGVGCPSYRCQYRLSSAASVLSSCRDQHVAVYVQLAKTLKRYSTLAHFT